MMCLIHVHMLYRSIPLTKRSCGENLIHAVIELTMYFRFPHRQVLTLYFRSEKKRASNMILKSER